MKKIAITVQPGKRFRLSEIDPDSTGDLEKEAALERFSRLQGKVGRLQEALYAENKRSLLIIFQAMDTGGKDGAIRNLCTGLNPAGLEIRSFKAPSLQELDHGFLWRAQCAAPSRGTIGIWNRSHYEDVLVARVHKLVSKNVWKARYDQINRFEQNLAANGTMILKFMLHISKDEQKKRLQARLDDPEKRVKFDVNDLKERSFWKDYEKAYEDAIHCCTTKWAPWHIVPANRKWARNLAIIELVHRALKKMDPHYPKPSFYAKEVVID
jgi:PPK2 family polyphosphate:nucleotide phosphotransferase